MTSPGRTIQYLSAPAQVSMADRWFEIATIDHFWIQRRFEVLTRLAGGLITGAKEIAEIGCGHGLLQAQIEQEYDRKVIGFDLNEFALKQNISRYSEICCYDIYEKHSGLYQRYDLILLFDVLEHISDEDSFLRALRHHLAPGGRLIINVPAGQWVYSKYDEAAGHIRRYSIRYLQEVARRDGFEIAEWSYWGLPLVPVLLLRKAWLSLKRGEARIISAGFDSRSNTINGAMRTISRWEVIPQKFLGSSLMAVLEMRPLTK
jgi:SAM-dependent methyltransferase